MPSIAELIREWAPKIDDPHELFELIHREHPGVTPPVVIAELRRQAAADHQEADALERVRRPANDDR